METRSEFKSRYFNPDLELASPETLKGCQWDALQQLLKSVSEGNRFYQEKWAAAGIRDWREINSLEAFQELPFTTRIERSEDQESHPPYGTNLTWPLDRYTHWHRTSGTKGKPLIVLSTREDWATQGTTWCYNYAAVGLSPGDSIYIAFSFGPFAGLWNAVAGAEMSGILMIPGGGQSTLQRIQFILQHRPTAVVSIPSYALRMAEVARENNLDLRKAGVRTLVHGGEPGPSIPAVRRRIEAAWGAKSYDSTGLTEVGHHGFECLAQDGVHLIESEFLVEVVEPDGARPVPPSEVGEMVVTALTRSGMPTIRYRTGDLVRLNREPCQCGRTFTRMEGGILGRVDGMITVRGINVYPTAIEDCLMARPEVAEFLVEIYELRGMKEIRVQVEAIKSDPSEQDCKSISDLVAQDLYQRLSLRAEIVVLPAGALPRPAGKANRFRYSA